MERSPAKWRWERGWRDLAKLGLLMRRMALDWTLSRRQTVYFWATLQTWEQYSKEGPIWDLYIVRRWEDEKDPRALAREPSFWDPCLAREWMWVFQVTLDERERPSCVKEVEVSSSSPFMRTGGKLWLWKVLVLESFSPWYHDMHVRHDERHRIICKPELSLHLYLCKLIEDFPLANPLSTCTEKGNQRLRYNLTMLQILAKMRETGLYIQLRYPYTFIDVNQWRPCHGGMLWVPAQRRETNAFATILPCYKYQPRWERLDCIYNWDILTILSMLINGGLVTGECCEYLHREGKPTPSLQSYHATNTSQDERDWIVYTTEISLHFYRC